MALSKKHFRAIADILADYSPASGLLGHTREISPEVHTALVADFARYFRHENGRFDVDRFTRAANGDDA